MIILINHNIIYVEVGMYSHEIGIHIGTQSRHLPIYLVPTTYFY